MAFQKLSSKDKQALQTKSHESLQTSIETFQCVKAHRLNDDPQADTADLDALIQDFTQAMQGK